MNEIEWLENKPFKRLTEPVYPHLYCIHAAYILQHKKSGLIYVGSTKNLRKRIAEHRNSLIAGTNTNPNLQRAYYEDDGFEIFYLKVKCREEAYAIEQELIDHYYPLGKLLNVDIDARNISGWALLPEETRNKLRLNGLENLTSQDIKKEQSRSSKARWSNPEFRKKQVAIKRSEENISRMREIVKRNWSDPVISAKLREHRASPEFREIISKINAKPVIIDGIEYPSVTKAAAALGMHRVTLTKYLEDPSRYIRKSDNEYETKPVTIDGVTYPNLKEAAKQLGINGNIPYTRLRIQKT